MTLLFTGSQWKCPGRKLVSYSRIIMLLWYFGDLFDVAIGSFCCLLKTYHRFYYTFKHSIRWTICNSRYICVKVDPADRRRHVSDVVRVVSSRRRHHSDILLIGKLGESRRQSVGLIITTTGHVTLPRALVYITIGRDPVEKEKFLGNQVGFLLFSFVYSDETSRMLKQTKMWNICNWPFSRFIGPTPSTNGVTWGLTDFSS